MRITVGKTQRFEVFKRDGFTCQYCGAPPSIVLEVDHIVPVVSGGTNDDGNLITACFDCNRGKAARHLDVVPQSLSERAAEIAEREEQLIGYNRVIAAQRERVEDDVWTVFAHWRNQTSTSKDRFNSVKQFVMKLGLPEVLDAVDIATAQHRPDYAEWRYFCGVCWNKMRDKGL